MTDAQNQSSVPFSASTRRSAGQKLAWVTATVVWHLTLTAGMLTIGGYFAEHAFVLELICHFRVQYLVSLALACILFAVLRQWRRSAVAGLLAALNLSAILPLYWSPTSVVAAPSPDHRLRIVAANVFTANTRYEKVLKLIEDEHPDIVVLSEIDDRWVSKLVGLRRDYPHFREVPNSDSFGIAIYSKLPFTDIRVLELGDARVPAIAMTVEQNDKLLTIYAVHVLPPSSRANWVDRNLALQQLTSDIQKSQSFVVVVGDLNTTSWSPVFTELAQQANLIDSRQGLGVHATFPARQFWLRIPIDHCLVRPGLSVVDRRVGPPVGSDHLPIVVDLSLPVEDANTGAR